jgi:hypothetical protein
VGKLEWGERSGLNPVWNYRVNRAPNDFSGETRSVLTRKMPFLYVKRVFLNYITNKSIRVNEGTKRVPINAYM